MKALDVLARWNKEIEAKCEALLGNEPEGDTDFKTLGPRAQRRASMVVTH